MPSVYKPGSNIQILFRISFKTITSYFVTCANNKQNIPVSEIITSSQYLSSLNLYLKENEEINQVATLDVIKRMLLLGKLFKERDAHK